jgi:hypothetical protein
MDLLLILKFDAAKVRIIFQMAKDLWKRLFGNGKC